jgi:hypothetical protein
MGYQCYMVVQDCSPGAGGGNFDRMSQVLFFSRKEDVDLAG